MELRKYRSLYWYWWADFVIRLAVFHYTQFVWHSYEDGLMFLQTGLRAEQIFSSNSWQTSI